MCSGGDEAGADGGRGTAGTVCLDRLDRQTRSGGVHLFVVLQVAEDLMQQLGVSKESLVTGAYMDLLLKGQTQPCSAE